MFRDEIKAKTDRRNTLCTIHNTTAEQNYEIMCLSNFLSDVLTAECQIRTMMQTMPSYDTLIEKLTRKIGDKRGKPLTIEELKEETELCVKILQELE